MDLRTRIVTRIPLDELWTQDGRVDAVRLRKLSRLDIHGMLRGGSVQFVRADVAQPLEWIDQSERFAFWKSEVQHRVVDPAEPAFDLNDHPGGYCYLASEWRAEGQPPIVLVERYH